MEYPKRKPIRLPEFDYDAGAYFVTICTQDRKRILSDITVGEGLAPPVCRQSDIGNIVEHEIQAIPERYPNVSNEKYVIMPNHVHMIVMIHADAGGASPSPTLMDVVRVIKSNSARRTIGTCLWQRSYHEHVIRNEQDYREIWNYIDGNPVKWAEDRYFTMQTEAI